MSYGYFYVLQGLSCYWPPGPLRDVTKRVKSGEVADPSWNLHLIKILGASGTYI